MIYDIDAEIMRLVDPETGEILDEEAFVKIERDAKIENTALWIKNLNAEAEAIKAEEDALKARRVATENKAKRLKEHLATMLDDSPFKTARVSCSLRKSPPSVKFADEKAFISKMLEADRDEFLSFKMPEINRSAVKDAIQNGVEVEGAELVQNSYVYIK